MSDTGRRAILIVFFAYVLLDLSCPLLPGAFRFEPAASVEAVNAHRPPAVPRIDSMGADVTPSPRPAETIAHGADAPTLPPAPWRPHAVRDQLGASEPRPPVEDD